MNEYLKAKNDRISKCKALSDLIDHTAKLLEDAWRRLEQQHEDLQNRKDVLAQENGGANVSYGDILDINAGGQIIRVSRGTLTQIKGSRLEAIFSGRWEKHLQRDRNGRIFLDVNPVCFRSIVDYLNEVKITPPDSPPDLPSVDSENALFLSNLVDAFGISENFQVSGGSNILTNVSLIKSLADLFPEDMGKSLSLLYQGSRDGMNSSAFHQKCDHQAPTVTVVKSTQNHIFGGFANIPWHSNKSEWQYSDKAFLFILDKGRNEKFSKLSIINQDHDYALCNLPDSGPAFGQGHDLVLFYKNKTKGYECQNNTYQNFQNTIGNSGDVKEVEVFKVIPAPLREVVYQFRGDESWKSLTIEKLPQEIQKLFHDEKEALLTAYNEFSKLEDSFQKEKAAVRVFCQNNDDEIVFLNVSGKHMAVKQATLAKYPESILYKQFADPTWKGKAKSMSPREWSSREVIAWCKEIKGLSTDVSSNFKNVTGAELLALEREDIKDLGIERPGSIALITKSIQKLRDEDNERSSTFIEQSDYCFGKIIDHMRLKAMEDLDIPSPSPPEIREPDRKRFKRIVDYYFPGEEASKQFLG